MDDVFAYIEQHRARFVDELCALLRQPSVSTQDQGVRECAELVRRQMDDAGLDARLLPTAGYPVVFGTAGPGETPAPSPPNLAFSHQGRLILIWVRCLEFVDRRIEES